MESVLRTNSQRLERKDITGDEHTVLVARLVARLLGLTQGSEPRPDLLREKLWLLPRGEVSALLNLVVMDKFGIRPLGPAPRGWIKFVREDAYGNRDGDAFGIEIPEFAPILPIETGARKRRVRQPGDRDVVEDVVARETFGFSLKDA